MTKTNKIEITTATGKFNIEIDSEYQNKIEIVQHLVAQLDIPFIDDGETFIIPPTIDLNDWMDEHQDMLDKIVDNCISHQDDGLLDEIYDYEPINELSEEQQHQLENKMRDNYLLN